MGLESINVLPGVAVTVLRPTTTRDAYGRAQTTWAAERVSPCLWFHAVGSADNADDADFGGGDYGTLGVHMPKAYVASLAGCLIRLADGSTWDVIGDPAGNMPSLTPGPYGRVVRCNRHVGADLDGVVADG